MLTLTERKLHKTSRFETLGSFTTQLQKAYDLCLCTDVIAIILLVTNDI